jgi:hypothetical protein
VAAGAATDGSVVAGEQAVVTSARHVTSRTGTGRRMR